MSNLTTTEVNEVCNTDHVKCCCGKQCKGLRGLKMHQRSCRVIKDLDKELTYHIDYGNEPLDSAEDGRINDYIQDLPNIKLGVKLPTSESQWDEANAYFKATLPVHEINSNNVNDCVSKMNNTFYDYFQKAYGNIKSSDVLHYRELHKDFSKHQLKSELKNLKNNCGSLEKISYVSKLLRSKIQSKNEDQLHRDNIDMTDHDAKVKENLWK